MVPDEIRKKIEAANAWLGLGSNAEALNELNTIPKQYAHTFEAMVCRLSVYRNTGDLENLKETAEAFTRIYSNDPLAWTFRSMLVLFVNGPRAAYDFLRPKLDEFPYAWQISFLLARIVTWLGDKNAALAQGRSTYFLVQSRELILARLGYTLARH